MGVGFHRLSGTDGALTVGGVVLAAAAGAGAAAAGYWALIPIGLAVGVLIARFAWRGISRGTPESPNWLLIALPTSLSTSAISNAVTVAILAALGVLSLAATVPADRTFRLGVAALTIPAVTLAIALRPNPPSSTLGVIALVLGLLVTLRAVSLSHSREHALVSLIDGVGLFSVASVVLWLAGVVGKSERTAALDNSITGGDRIIFPLSTSLAATPAMASVYLAAVAPILIASRQHRLPRLLAAGCAAAILILSNTRIAMAVAALLCLVLLLAPKVLRRAAPILVGGSFLVPFFYPDIRDGVGWMMRTAGSYLPWLVRREEHAADLNGRERIWANALTFYSDRTGLWRQMVGFGSYGHAESGASSSYYRNFTGFGDKRLVTPHNSALQLLFDGGWLALGVVVVVTVLVAWRLARRPSPPYLAALSLLVAIALSAVTEVLISPGHAQPTFWVYLTLCVVVLSSDRPASPAPRTSSPRMSATGQPPH